jgi:hypothetical protein
MAASICEVIANFEVLKLRRIDLDFGFLHMWSVHDPHPDIWVTKCELQRMVYPPSTASA